MRNFYSALALWGLCSVCASGNASENIWDVARKNIGREQTYRVYLNPFFLEDLSDKLKANGVGAASVPVVLNSEEKWRYISENIDQLAISPALVSLRDGLLEHYGVKNIQHQYYSAPAFVIKVTDSLAKKMSGDPRVSYVERVEDLPAKMSSFVSGLADYNYFSDRASWGRKAVGIYDDVFVPRSIHVIDQGWQNSTIQDVEMNIVSRLNILNLPMSAEGHFHSTAVMGVIGARKNSAYTIGINPNQPIRLYAINPDKFGGYVVGAALDKLVKMLELSGEFGVVNVSVNDGPGSNGFIRLASNRLFIAQSAGNYNESACMDAYSPVNNLADPNDGIMVVGGYNQQGMRSGHDGGGSLYNLPYWVFPSNYGKCVDIWAPSHSIVVAPSQGGVNKVSSGTSFAAPVVAAIASRYAPEQPRVRPWEYEQYVRMNAVPTGHYDPMGLPIKSVFYKNSPYGSVPSYRSIRHAISPGTTNGKNYAAHDAVYFNNDTWNALAPSGSITVELENYSLVKGVRLTMRSSEQESQLNVSLYGDMNGMSANPGVYHQVKPVDAIPLASFVNTYSDQTGVFIPFSNPRYLKRIRIDGVSSNSWFALSEIEVFGN